MLALAHLQCLAHVFSPQSGGKWCEDKCQEIRDDGADSGGLKINELHLLGLVLVWVFEEDICPAQIPVTNSTEMIVLVHWEDEGFKTNINSTGLFAKLIPHNNRLREGDKNLRKKGKNNFRNVNQKVKFNSDDNCFKTLPSCVCILWKF